MVWPVRKGKTQTWKPVAESWAGGVRHGIGGNREALKVLEQRNGLVRLAGAKLTLPLAGVWVRAEAW